MGDAVSPRGENAVTGGEAVGDDINWLETKLGDTSIDRNTILVPKDKRGDVGSRDYLRYLKFATDALDPKFGVPSHLVSTHDGKTESGNQTKHQFIQETFCSNNDKVERALRRFESYDMVGIFKVPNVINQNGSTPGEIFGREKTNMVLHWASM